MTTKYTFVMLGIDCEGFGAKMAAVTWNLSNPNNRPFLRIQDITEE